MENEKEEKEETKPRPKKRVTSLKFFKKRKKPEIRPFVAQKKTARFKKIISSLIVGIIILFLCVGVLFALRLAFEFYVEYKNNGNITNPNVAVPITDEEIHNLLVKTDIEIEEQKDASASSRFLIKIKNGPYVIFSDTKDLEDQLTLLKSILRRLTIENKKPTLIDLRYNKPIVKF